MPNTTLLSATSEKVLKFRIQAVLGVVFAYGICFVSGCQGDSSSPRFAYQPGIQTETNDPIQDEWTTGSIDEPARTRPALDLTTRGSTWSLVLETFSEGDHAMAAARMVSTLRTIAPQLSSVRVHTSPRGSMVVYGNYSNRDDPAADVDRTRLKQLTYQDRPLFNRVILTHLEVPVAQQELHPYDLRSARNQFPNVNPLYTLDIAVWDDFGSGELSYAQLRRDAEAYATRLRTQGVMAYFYHDNAAQRSGVTVGLFDRRAIHPTSGLYAPEVDDLIRKFPVRLVNGEELHELINRLRPEKGTRPQRPALVLVPSN